MVFDHGLSNTQLSEIKRILYPFAGNIESVGFFGSRATGKYRPNSDIDMVIYGDLSEKNTDRIATLFGDSKLPVKVDVIAYNHITYPTLKAHIDAVVKTLFTHEDLEI
jgi:predicted nucleotidyltransferase